MFALVWRSLNPLNNSVFIAGKPAIPPEADQPQAETSLDYSCSEEKPRHPVDQGMSLEERRHRGEQLQ